MSSQVHSDDPLLTRLAVRLGEPVLKIAGNPVVRVVLRSRLNWLFSGNTLLLTVIGRKSGKGYRIPISYIRDGGVVTGFTAANWWKNLRGGAPVQLLVRGERLEGVATPSRGSQNVEIVRALLSRVPRGAVFHGVRRGEGGQFDLERASRNQVMVRIRVDPVPRSQL